MPDSIVVSGASYLIGRALCCQLRAWGHEVIALSRTLEPLPGISVTVTWDDLRTSIIRVSRHLRPRWLTSVFLSGKVNLLQ
jgi:short-subunit dehydrogenase